MHNVSTGNAATDAQSRGGWFVGHFISDDALRHSRDVEIKWGIHPRGDANKGGFVANKTATTMSILVSGDFQIRFRDASEIDTVQLNAPGKYALWMPGVEHDWVALQDSVVLTVRWPSVPKDQG